MVKTETKSRIRNIFAHSSLNEFRFDGDIFDQWYIPGRALAMALSYPDSLVILPDTREMRAYQTQFAQAILGLGLACPETAFVPDSEYLLDDAIRKDLPNLTTRLNRQTSYVVHSYARTHETDRWIKDLQANGFDVTSDFPLKPYLEDPTSIGHRGGWGRWVQTPSTPSFPEKYGISYPTSWIGQGITDIEEAYHRASRASETGHVFFKPIVSAGGFTLARIDSVDHLRAHYAKLMTEGSLTLFDQEIPVEMQAAIDVKALRSFQYYGPRLVTPGILTTQIQDSNSNSWAGNRFNDSHSPPSLAQAVNTFNRIKYGFEQETGQKLSGPGGADLAETESGQPVLELNACRITGGHPAIAMATALHVSEKPFLVRKTPNPGSDLETLMVMLRIEKMAFDAQTKTGLFPLLWLPGQGFLFAAGQNNDDNLRMTDRALNLAAKNGYVHP